MATNYPTGLDTDGDLPAKSSGNTIPSADWNRITDAIQALQAKVGIDASAVAGSVDNLVKKPNLTTAKRYYCDPNGSDSYDGLSQRFPKATVAAVMTLVSTQADVFFGPATFAWTDTVTVPQSVRLHGTSPHATAGLGTEWVWSGADDGRPGLITSTSSSADWSQGIIENIRFAGSGAMSGGGNCLDIRNPQNAAKMFNVRVVNWDTGAGIHVYSTKDTGYPGYASFENVWVTGGTTAGWDIECPMTDLLFLHCASDPVTAHATDQAWLVRAAGYPYGAAVNKTITSSSSSGSVATHVCTGHGLSVGYTVDISGTSVAAYHGVFRVDTVADANTFTVNTGAVTGIGAATGGTAFRAVQGDRGTATFIACKSESGVVDAGWMFRGSTGIVMLGCSYFEQTDNADGVAFTYLGPIKQQSGDMVIAPRVDMLGCISQNMEYVFSAPFHGIQIAAEEGFGGGRFQHFTYTSRSNTSATDLVGVSAPEAPQSGTRRLFTDVATGELSVRTSAGATVSLEASAGGGAPTTADYLVATAQGGLSAEIVVGATPGGELGGTWGTPTVDGTHSGSAHTDFIAKALVDAKGDVLTASAADTPVRLAVGTDFVDSLVPDASQSSGLAWTYPRNPLRPSGALYETFERQGSTIVNAAVLASQRVTMVGIALPAGLTVTSITFDSGTTALGTGVHQFFGLYRASDRVLLRGTVDDTSTAWAANAPKTLALTSTFVTAYSGFYYLAILVEATTVPSLGCVVSGATGANTVATILTGISSTAVSALPDPAASITAATNGPWAYVS